ncbi:PilZ domain-containing protein [Nodosilinea sp. FACHB-131]|uniref:PilZ domain-containing protein n=1 Tax=Cyanophyceae TaxID=3028117 RepID=UPI0016857E88|nr:PilZ domain-containing protein [Nodosilinea sp. FACHB-131]MBD1876239.1 PilZ domain-containing protein [Nodosilinea sp. FACHB-131]
MTAFISIPPPKYELGADVWLLFHGSTIPTSIKVRHFDPDQNAWYYRVALSGQWHIEDDLGPRIGEAA